MHHKHNHDRLLRTFQKSLMRELCSFDSYTIHGFKVQNQTVCRLVNCPSESFAAHPCRLSTERHTPDGAIFPMLFFPNASNVVRIVYISCPIATTFIELNPGRRLDSKGSSVMISFDKLLLVKEVIIF